MQIPLLDLTAQYKSIKDEIDEALDRVVTSQHFILGGEVEAFEKEVAGYAGTKYAIGVASGTDALTLSLRACGIGEGDEVITSPFTFFATAESISQVGARPVFADIDPETYNIDPEKMEAAITKNTKAVIPVYLYGQSADMARIMDIAEKNKLKVIEDCAQAMGAEYKGKSCGSFGDCGCLSFFPSKNLGGFGDGGMIVTNDEELMNKIKMIRVHGSSKQYIHEFIGYNSRLDSLQAAILRVKLKYLDNWIEGRRRNAAYYDSYFKNTDVVTPKESPDAKHTYHQYTISIKERDALSAYLKQKGIGSRVYYPLSLHLQPCYKELGYREGDFPVTEKVCREVLSIPVYPELTGEQLAYVADSVSEFVKKGVQVR
ncbi:MAG: DegT/DnrJ/EryC1/StrS family aminotransferase [Candidatus Omnitrophota bacterium]